MIINVPTIKVVNYHDVITESWFKPQTIRYRQFYVYNWAVTYFPRQELLKLLITLSILVMIQVTNYKIVEILFEHIDLHNFCCDLPIQPFYCVTMNHAWVNAKQLKPYSSLYLYFDLLYLILGLKYNIYTTL